MNHDPNEGVLYNRMSEINIPTYRAINRLIRMRKVEPVNGTGPYPNELDNLIAKLCGYKDGSDMARNFRDETLHTLELFREADMSTAYTIYKALEAKHK